MATRLFQSKLGKYHDNLRQKLTDNAISLSGHATDCIKIRIKKTKQLDIDTRVVESLDVVSLILPPLVDIPYRKLTKQGDTTYRLESFVSSVELFPFAIIAPHIANCTVGDLLFRVLQDSHAHDPVVMALEITESKGTFGVQSMLYSKFDCVYYNETLPLEILQAITEIAERRQYLRW